MCVDPDFSDEKDICFNYYNKLNFHNNQAYKCSKIGCKFSKKLKRIDSSGMVLDGSCVHPDFIKDNKLDFYKVGDYVNTKKKNKKNYCLDLGCKYINNKCIDDT